MGFFDTMLYGRHILTLKDEKISLSLKEIEKKEAKEQESRKKVKERIKKNAKDKKKKKRKNSTIEKKVITSEVA